MNMFLFLNARPARKSLEDRSPATGLSWNPVTPKESWFTRNKTINLCSEKLHASMFCLVLSSPSPTSLMVVVTNFRFLKCLFPELAWKKGWQSCYTSLSNGTDIFLQYPLLTFEELWDPLELGDVVRAVPAVLLQQREHVIVLVARVRLHNHHVGQLSTVFCLLLLYWRSLKFYIFLFSPCT